MNPRWLFIRRMRGPAFLLTFGLTALLNQWDVVSFGKSWPLYLIVAGVLTLLERSAMTYMPLDPGPYPTGSYPNQQYPNAPYPNQGQQSPQGWSQPNEQPGTSSTAIVPTGPTDITPEGRR